jgi:predicted Zn-dependent peptidase
MSFRVPRPPTSAGNYASNFVVSSRNGTTNFDETEYFTTTPSGNLPYAIWSERWRMGIDLDEMLESDRRQELDVVKNERRERLEIMPYRAGRHRLWSELFPAAHPYHEEVIGSMKDLEAIRLDDVRTYFKTYYGPSNATLAVVGDFDPGQARQIIERYFGPLPTTPPPPQPATPSRAITQEVVIRHQEQFGRMPLLHMAWHTPAIYSADNAIGDVTAAVVGGLEANRIMMYVPQAEWVSAQQHNLIGGSVFHLLVRPRPGVSLDDLQRKVDSLLAFMRTRPAPDAQVDCAVRSLLRDRLRAMEHTLSKAQFYVDVLSKTAATGDPLAFEQSRYLAVTAADVQRFVTTYLVPNKRVTLYSQPGAAP